MRCVKRASGVVLLAWMFIALMGENLTPRDVGPFGSKAECERVRAWPSGC